MSEARQAIGKMQGQRNTVPVNEIGTVIIDGGYQLDVHSNDQNPPRIHVLHDNNEICQIEVMPKKPNTIDDIVPYHSAIADEVKRDLLELLNKSDEDNLPVWLVCKTAWRVLHPVK